MKKRDAKRLITHHGLATILFFPKQGLLTWICHFKKKTKKKNTNINTLELQGYIFILCEIAIC